MDDLEEDSSYATINDIPEEILEYIIAFLSAYRDLKPCTCVSKTWYYITKGKALVIS